MFNYLVVSHKDFKDAKCYGFEDYEAAQDFLHKEEYDFRTRHFYECTNGRLPNDFIQDWCWTEEMEKTARENWDEDYQGEFDPDVAAEKAGYYWDEYFEQYTDVQIVD